MDDTDQTSTVLVVDDDEAVGRVLAALLQQDGLRASFVASPSAALGILERRSVDAVISDVRMPLMDGLELLKTLRARFPELPVILMTAHGTVPLAVEAMKQGAADFLLKPFDRAEVLYVVRKALTASYGSRLEPPQAALPEAPTADGMLGDAPALREARALIRRAAPSTATVLIRGETGTGKELAARAIHALSPRAQHPFIRVNCGALPEALFESEVFGHEKGAFTGAVSRKPGRVELASGGTLFLDEVGELGLTSQVKLLRLLQEREYERVGGTQTLKADLRVVAATHRPLEDMVRTGAFREDFLYRLNVIPITLPPLRARPGDVAALATAFVATLGPQNGRPRASLTREALELLAHQQWPGNVRQLQNFLERLVILAPPGDTLSAENVRVELERAGPSPSSGSSSSARSPAHSSAGARGGGPHEVLPDEATSPSLDAQRDEAERNALEEALRKAAGNRSLAARLLGISRRTLYNKLDALKLG